MTVVPGLFFWINPPAYKYSPKLMEFISLNIVNFIVVGYVPPRENKRKLIYKIVSTYEMNHTSSEFTLTVYSEDVYQWKKASRSANDATHHHTKDIMVHSALIGRSRKVDSSSQPCMKI
jgi:hypothetical protein